MALIYQDLIELALNQEGATSQFTNRKSTLLGYLKHLGLDENSHVGPELADINGINRWLESGSFVEATKRSYRTHMRAWQAFHQRLLSAQNLPDDPRERTKAVTLLAIEKTGSIAELARLTGISAESISDYVRGRYAVGTRVFAIRLENAAGLLAGSLSARIHRETRGDSFCPASLMPEQLGDGVSRRVLQNRQRRLRWLLPDHFTELPESEKRSLVDQAAEKILSDQQYLKMQSARTKRYGLTQEETPDRLRKQIDAFITYKTEKKHVLAVSGIIPRPAIAGPVSKQTAHNWRQFFRQFFGWCILEDAPAYEARTGHQPDRVAQQLLGAGMHPDELTLGLLAVPRLVHEYLNWRFTVRTDGSNRYTSTVLAMISSLNHPTTGYLTRMPELIHQVPPRYIQRYKQGFLDELDRLEGGLSDKIKQARTALARTFDEDTPMEDE